jgi:hypothetical protein
MAKNYPKTMQYLESLGIDPGSVARTGISPEGYYSPTGTVSGNPVDGFQVDKGWTLWPGKFNYELFQKYLWQDEFQSLSKVEDKGLEA